MTFNYYDPTPCDCDCDCARPLGTRRIAFLATLLCEHCAHGLCISWPSLNARPMRCFYEFRRVGAVHSRPYDDNGTTRTSISGGLWTWACPAGDASGGARYELDAEAATLRHNCPAAREAAAAAIENERLAGPIG